MHYFLLAAAHLVFALLFEASGEPFIAALQLGAAAGIAILGVMSIAARH